MDQPSDALDLFLEDIRRYPLLGKDQEVDLVGLLDLIKFSTYGVRKLESRALRHLAEERELEALTTAA